MRIEPIARGRVRAVSQPRHIDASGMIVVASLAAAVFACFFLIGRAASPHTRSAVSSPPSISPLAASIPLRMSAAPALALGVAAASPASKSVAPPSRTESATRSPLRVVSESPTGSSSPTASQSPVQPAVTTAPATAPSTHAPSTHAGTPASGEARKSSGGQGTSFDTSG